MGTPADTSEWRWVPVYQQTKPDDDTTITLFTGAIDYAVHPDGYAGTKTYTPAIVRGGYTGVIITGLTPGTYHVWAKPTAPPDTPVVDCGTFTLTQT